MYRFLKYIWFLFILEFELNQCFHKFTSSIQILKLTNNWATKNARYYRIWVEEMWQGCNNYKIRTITNKQQKSYGSKGEGTITGEGGTFKKWKLWYVNYISISLLLKCIFGPQYHFWVYIQRSWNQDLKEVYALPCPLQHYSQ